MTRYLLGRAAHAALVLACALALAFALFFAACEPPRIARARLGPSATEAQVAAWLAERGYDRPLLWNAGAEGPLARVTETIFFRRAARLLALDPGLGDDGTPLGPAIRERLGPTLAITLPILLVGLALEVAAALALAAFRGTAVDHAAGLACLVLLSISAMFFVLLGQRVFSDALRWAPVSGWDGGLRTLRFAALPVGIGVASALGAGTRWYRAIIAGGLDGHVIRAARAQGLSRRALAGRLLRASLVPIISSIASAVPGLLLGGAVLEAYFAIPGLGAFAMEAVRRQDFAAVQATVLLGATLQVAALLATDAAYALADPRIRGLP